MSEMRIKLAEYMQKAARATTGFSGSADERWVLVADYIDCMIERAVLETTKPADPTSDKAVSGVQK